MNTKKLHQLHPNKRTARFSEQKTSVLTVRQLCNQDNYSIHTYNYWEYLLKEELASHLLPVIVPLVIPEPVIFPESTVSIAPASEKLYLTNCTLGNIEFSSKLNHKFINSHIDSYNFFFEVLVVTY